MPRYEVTLELDPSYEDKVISVEYDKERHAIIVEYEVEDNREKKR